MAPNAHDSAKIDARYAADLSRLAKKLDPEPDYAGPVVQLSLEPLYFVYQAGEQ